jgi:hypothetical protein
VESQQVRKKFKWFRSRDPPSSFAIAVFCAQNSLNIARKDAEKNGQTWPLIYRAKQDSLKVKTK